ncbi:acyl-coenzyme A thioesterase THEM4 isoform X2 [Toxotes jaculatrix]|uniref:acyl-coenzyme A thioesterase THEM4 isoform X2 n=1 Tax=Toxotes jaculatrix TaxID=941984 RepID=UPI001B3B143D|nr:acyl-coenzyme A thioesterase THEM4 isoform X2 [Toxotes jaculatrix]
MTMSLGRLFKGFQSLTSLPAVRTQLSHRSSCVSFRTNVALPSPFSSKPRDFSLPNSSWGPEMMQLYEHYNSQCAVETEDGEKQGGTWTRLPSYNRSLKYATGGVYLSKIIQSKARLFTRNIRDTGAAFEYVLFVNKEEDRCVCIFQAGHLLEGPPGHVHGGAIATMIDTVTGTHASLLSAPVMTANLNINYRNPIPLGSTVLIESCLDAKEGRKTFISCKVSSTDGSKLHTEATGNVHFYAHNLSDGTCVKARSYICSLTFCIVTILFCSFFVVVVVFHSSCAALFLSINVSHLLRRG